MAVLFVVAFILVSPRITFKNNCNCWKTQYPQAFVLGDNPQHSGGLIKQADMYTHTHTLVIIHTFLYIQYIYTFIYLYINTCICVYMYIFVLFCFSF